ncbi:MAG: (4Fe-4S)-binding protein [Flavobacteriales bacterium]
MKKEYTNGEVTITWQPKLCIHSGVCVRGLPAVFTPKDAPWIKTDKATTNELVEQVKLCPSGALTYSMNDTSGDSEIEANSHIV